MLFSFNKLCRSARVFFVLFICFFMCGISGNAFAQGFNLNELFDTESSVTLEEEDEAVNEVKNRTWIEDLPPEQQDTEILLPLLFGEERDNKETPKDNKKEGSAFTEEDWRATAILNASYRDEQPVVFCDGKEYFLIFAELELFLEILKTESHLTSAFLLSGFQCLQMKKAIMWHRIFWIRSMLPSRPHGTLQLASQ